MEPINLIKTLIIAVMAGLITGLAVGIIALLN